MLKYLLPLLLLSCGQEPRKVEVILPKPDPAPCLCPACPIVAQPMPTPHTMPN